MGVATKQIANLFFIRSRTAWRKICTAMRCKRTALRRPNWAIKKLIESRRFAEWNRFELHRHLVMVISHVLKIPCHG
jgi:hypothetical protein